MSRYLSVLQLNATRRRRAAFSSGDHCVTEGIPSADGGGSTNFSVTYFCLVGVVDTVGRAELGRADVDFERRLRELSLKTGLEVSRVLSGRRRFRGGLDMVEMLSIPLD